MTTYATTYGWRSTRVREDLMTSPPEQNPVNGAKGDQRGSMGALTISLRIRRSQVRVLPSVNKDLL